MLNQSKELKQSKSSALQFIFKAICVLLCLSVFWLSLSLQQAQFSKYATLSLICFCVGLYGLMTSNSLIKTIISIEIMLNSANINFIAFSRFLDINIFSGQIFALFVIALAAAEVALGLTLIILSHYHNKNISVSGLSEMKG